MYRRGSFFMRGLWLLLLVGALIFGGVLIYNAGYALGYATSGTETGLPAQGAPAPPAGMPYLRPSFFFFPFAPLMGLLCFGGLMFLIVFSLAAVFRPHGWHHHGWRGYAGSPDQWGKPPWVKGQREAPEAQDESQKPGEGVIAEDPAS